MYEPIIGKRSFDFKIIFFEKKEKKFKFVFIFFGFLKLQSTLLLKIFKKENIKKQEMRLLYGSL